MNYHGTTNKTFVTCYLHYNFCSMSSYRPGCRCHDNNVRNWWHMYTNNHHNYSSWANPLQHSKC